MKFVLGWLLLGCLSWGQDLYKTLALTEVRYNSLKTMQVPFKQIYRPPGRPRIVESGTLLLSKPGKMRWTYDQPAGKLFVTDGKIAMMYTPSANRVEKMALKETDDFRAPLAFLLGKLDFRKYFGKFQTGDGWITAWPKNNAVPYKSVRMKLGADGQIQFLSVEGSDGAWLDFEFGNESLAVKANPAMFQFQPPPGVEFIDETRDEDKASKQ
jgi:outer membrane lipoprotein carrier protein